MSVCEMMSVRGSARVVVCAAGLAMGLCSTRAMAQDLLTADGGWAAPAPFHTSTVSGDIGGNVNTTPLEMGGIRVMRGDGFAREDRDAGNVADWVRTRFDFHTRTFTIGAAPFLADVVVPMLFDGSVTFAGAGNISAWRDARMYVSLEHNHPVNGWTFVDDRFLDPANIAAAGGNQTIRRTMMARFEDQGPGQYRLSASTAYDGTAQGAIPGVPGTGGLNSRVDWDFRTALNDFGSVFSLSLEPANYENANSRDAVRAHYARSLHNVTGAGARVAVVEGLQVITNHENINMPVAQVLAGANAGRYESGEHATAVAGIIAARSTNAFPLTEAQAGVAPGANLFSASRNQHATTIAAVNAVRTAWGAGMPGVINFSAKGGMTREVLDGFLAANDNITWVSASGNDAGGPAEDLGDVTEPNHAFNNIAVGALDARFFQPTSFTSTTQGANPIKPDIMAPGEYVLSASVRDINNGGLPNDFARSFTGALWGRSAAANATDPISGGITGTSFAAPHVTGIIALAHELSDQRGFDARSKDRRVMKAVLLTGADTRSLRDRNYNAWSQTTNGGSASNINNPLRITGPMDPNLGAGKASAIGMLDVYAGGEARVADNNTDANFKIDLRNGSTIPPARRTYWDLETVKGSGTVDYMMGGTLAVIDDIPQFVTPPTSYLRTTLTWDREVTGANYDDLRDLDMRLYVDGYNMGNMPGFDPADPFADFLLADSRGTSNVELIDTSLSFLIALDNPVLPIGYNPNFYLQVRNFSAVDVEYGIAVTLMQVPAPAGLGLLALGGLLAVRRRRA